MDAFFLVEEEVVFFLLCTKKKTDSLVFSFLYNANILSPFAFLALL